MCSVQNRERRSPGRALNNLIRSIDVYSRRRTRTPAEMSLVGNFGANDNRGAESAKDGVSSVVTREEEVHQLARRFTEQSTYSTTVQNPFAADPGSALDPNGDNFNARAWCKAMLRMHTEDNQAHPLRTLA
ncbi:hypothetical protein CISG_01715 [Coccidioides immitis RMSCC 3703]|uniref:Pleiotropic ABC efflux transporter N-terminal domain-containing protein n=1 Tax=Coccidioides immitis RMSCC 3703 TaxID=454286 RepID=A0A0J8R2W8_COCIT|nr:hypothetical protein CISG_01715 [Coccidioides immitis RMSCC 3703]